MSSPIDAVAAYEAAQREADRLEADQLAALSADKRILRHDQTEYVDIVDGRGVRRQVQVPRVPAA
jgi:hypothetical protein